MHRLSISWMSHLPRRSMISGNSSTVAHLSSLIECVNSQENWWIEPFCESHPFRLAKLISNSRSAICDLWSWSTLLKTILHSLQSGTLNIAKTALSIAFILKSQSWHRCQIHVHSESRFTLFYYSPSLQKLIKFLKFTRRSMKKLYIKLD